MTYGGFLPKGVPVGYRIVVTTTTRGLAGGDMLFLYMAKVHGAWKIIMGGTSP